MDFFLNNQQEAIIIQAESGWNSVPS
jgi:hypothetical protein